MLGTVKGVGVPHVLDKAVDLSLLVQVGARDLAEDSLGFIVPALPGKPPWAFVISVTVPAGPRKLHSRRSLTLWGEDGRDEERDRENPVQTIRKPPSPVRRERETGS